MSVRVLHGDCLDLLPTLEADSIDAVVTDPPYHLTSIVKRFGSDSAAPAKSNGATGVYGRASAGFMGQKWDGGDVAFRPETWAEVLRVMKPGAHLLAFGAPRNFGFMQVAIAEAGFEIRDSILDLIASDTAVNLFLASLNDAQRDAFFKCIGESGFGGVLQWVFGSGFPKSHSIGRAIDRAADYELQAAVRRAAVDAVEAAGLNLPGNSRWDWTIGEHAPGNKWWAEFCRWLPSLSDDDRERVEGEIVARVQKAAGWFTSRDIYNVHAPATDAAREWEGWGTALKPAAEFICLARKPLSEKSVAANVLRWGTGALNIDASRVPTDAPRPARDRRKDASLDATRNCYGTGINGSRAVDDTTQGRWPGNVIHDGSPEVLEAFPNAPGQQGRVTGEEPSTRTRNVLGLYNDRAAAEPRNDTGTAARFFYCAKADADDRMGTTHPTTKPSSLIAYLARLITPPGGTILDPFAGSGTLAVAATREGFDAILIEKEADYVEMIKKRIAHMRGADTPLFGAQA